MSYELYEVHLELDGYWHIFHNGITRPGRYPTQQWAVDNAKNLARVDRGIVYWCNAAGDEIGRIDYRVAQPDDFTWPMWVGVCLVALTIAVLSFWR